MSTKFEKLVGRVVVDKSFRSQLVAGEVKDLTNEEISLLLAGLEKISSKDQNVSPLRW